MAAAPNQAQDINTPIRRVVTGHNASAQAIVASDTLLQPDPKPHGPVFINIWAEPSLPCDISSTATPTSTLPDDKGGPTSLAPSGATFRIVGFPPKSKSVFHRTITLDYAFVMEGRLTMALDDGSRTVLEKGDVVVQQGTMHRWDNDGDEWARALFVLVRAEGLRVGEKVLEEDVPVRKVGG